MNPNILQHYVITDNTTELKIQVEEQKFLVIYGRHINGYYIALPGQYISCEALGPDDVRQNTKYLSQAGLRSDYAEVVCTAIKDYIVGE